MSDKIKRKLILLMLTSGLAVSSLVTFSMNTFAENPGEHSNVASPSVISIQGDSKRCMKSRKTDELKVNLQEGAELVGFFSADPNVAAVNENTGEVTAVGAGETKIKAIAKKNGEEYTANCDIIVTGLVAQDITIGENDVYVKGKLYTSDGAKDIDGCVDDEGKIGNVDVSDFINKSKEIDLLNIDDNLNIKEEDSYFSKVIIRDNLTIPNGGKLDIQSGVTLDAEYLNTLNVNEGGIVNVEGSLSSVTGTVNINGTLNVNGFLDSGRSATININNGGTLNVLQKGTFSHGGDLNINGTLNVENKLEVTFYGTLNVLNGGTLNVNNNGWLNVHSEKQECTLNINEGGILNVNNGGLLYIINKGTLNIHNKGILNILHGGQLKGDIHLNVHNGGKFEVYGTLDGCLSRSNIEGQLDVFNGGVFNCSRCYEFKVTNGGILNIFSGAKLNTDGEFSVLHGGIFNVCGILNSNSESRFFVESGGNLHIQKGGKLNIQENSKFFLAQDGTFNINCGELNVKGNLFVFSGAILSVFEGSTLTVQNQGTLSVEAGGTLKGNINRQKEGNVTGVNNNQIVNV